MFMSFHNPLNYSSLSNLGFGPHALESNININSVMGFGHWWSWSRLGIIHHGNGSTKIHEWRNEIQSSGSEIFIITTPIVISDMGTTFIYIFFLILEWINVFLALPSNVDFLVSDQCFCRLDIEKEIHVKYCSQKNICYLW